MYTRRASVKMSCPRLRSLIYLISNCLFIVVISLARRVDSQPFRGQNSPPVFDIKRDWFIPENEPVGSRVITIRTIDDDRDNITYGLERSQYEHLDCSKYLTINPKSGDVFLKETFNGQTGQQYLIRVTAYDGHQVSKIDVRVVVSESVNRDESVVASPASDPLPGFPPPPFILNHRPKNPATDTANNRHHSTSSLDAGSHFPFSDSDPVSDRHPNPIHIIPTAIPLPPNHPHRTEYDDNFVLTGGRRLNQPVVRSQPGHDSGSNDRIGHRSDLIAFLPLIAVIVIGIVAGLVLVCFILRRESSAREKLNRIKELSLSHSLSQKVPLHFESSRETSISSTSSGESRMDYFNHLKYNKKTSTLCARYDSGHEFISSPFSVKENGRDEWEFPRKNLLFSRILGEGNFGQVWLCQAIDLYGEQKRETVAVKMLKQLHTEKEKKDLLSELAIMKILGHHPNVVSFLGCCSQQEPVYLIMEHLPNGKLQTYLRKSRQAGDKSILTAQDLTSFAYQIAKGMEYISSKGIIHRDLAARNVLLASDRTCKIADFGFARDVMTCANQAYERKSEGPLPIRWMAPESLIDHVYTTKSDVWSFGIVLWEIVTLGWTPYPGMEPQRIAREVPAGYRMDKPDHCRREMYHIMHYCWHQDPGERLTFTQVKEMLGNMLESDTDYIQLDQFPDRNYYNVPVVAAFQEKI